MLLISREYPPFVGGGIGTYTVRMARTLAGQGHEPVVVTVGDCNGPVVERDGSIRVVRLPFLDYVESQPEWTAPRASILASPSGPACHAAFWAFHHESVLAMQLREHLPWLLDEFRPDVIEAPDTGALLWFVLNERRLGRGPLHELGEHGPPVVVHLHSPTAWIEELQGGPEPRRASCELRSMERDVIRWADGIACPSHALAEWTQRWEPNAVGKIRVTPYPLGEPGEPPAVERPEIAALFVGRMERRKGFDTLVRAVAQLSDDGPTICVAGRDTFDWVAGHQFGQAALDEHGAGVAERFELLGELEPTALSVQRQRCAIALVPSPNDNFPNTCMEAMAAGQIVVAARAGGMAEMVEDGVSGVLFEPGDAEDLASAIRRITTMSVVEREQMARAASERIRAFCDDSRVVMQRLGHAHGLRPKTPAAAPAREVAVITFEAIDAEAQAALTDALRADPTIDAVVPWFGRWGPDGCELVPFSTPSREHLELLVDHPGPIAIDRTHWEEIEPSEPAGTASAILRALVVRGSSVAVLPELVIGGSAPDGVQAPGEPLVQRLSNGRRAASHLDKARSALKLAREQEHEALKQRDEARRERDTAWSEAEKAHAVLAEIRSSRAYKLAERLSKLRRRLSGDSLQ
ncbi:MAG: glycosyltransferase family 4 protein [Phycisphaerales bacterium]|nr:glycosyltransferase family 4 protein [Phycisphaerales bacterium]